MIDRTLPKPWTIETWTSLGPYGADTVLRPCPFLGCQEAISPETSRALRSRVSLFGFVVEPLRETYGHCHDAEDELRHVVDDYHAQLLINEAAVDRLISACREDVTARDGARLTREDVLAAERAQFGDWARLARIASLQGFTESSDGIFRPRVHGAPIASSLSFNPSRSSSTAARIAPIAARYSSPAIWY